VTGHYGATAQGQLGQVMLAAWEAHLFLQITSTCCDGGGCGAAFVFAGFLMAPCDCAGGCDNNGVVGEGARSPTCSSSWPGSAVFLLGIFFFGSSRGGRRDMLARLAGRGGAVRAQRTGRLVRTTAA
jgi:hypothetical protein